MSGEFIPMVIHEIRQETSEAVSIFLEYPSANRDKLHFKPGQYITVKWLDNGKEVRRSYSISSIPQDPYLAITVKEVEGGHVSPLLCRNKKPGDTLDILPPEGRFTADFGPENKRNIYLIGAGSGISPLISIARFVLEQEPKSSIILLYGSRSEEQIIFREELERLSKVYQNQFYVYHTLSKPGGSGMGIVKTLFGKKKPEWQGLKGRINEGQIKDLLKQHPSGKKNDLFFLCGPGDFIVMADKVLLSIGIEEEQIKKEFFTPSSTPGSPQEATKTHPAGQVSHVTVHLRGEKIEIDVKNKTILDTLLDEGYDAPYSCHSGACATCMAKVKHGEVTMDACFALSEKEVENGYILTCQSRPVTETVEISYED